MAGDGAAGDGAVERACGHRRFLKGGGHRTGPAQHIALMLVAHAQGLHHQLLRQVVLLGQLLGLQVALHRVTA